MSKSTPMRNGGGKVVGEILSELGTPPEFHKYNLNEMKHKLRSPSGWSLDYLHLLRLKEITEEDGFDPRDAKIILHLDDKTLRTTSLENAYSHEGIIHRSKPGPASINVDRGHGSQRVILDKYWGVSDDQQPHLF
jgi:hypothetical protein